MADTYSFYMTQADAARQSGEKAELANVRDSFERAEKVWRSLADKAQRVADARQLRESEASIRAGEAAAMAEAIDDDVDEVA